MKKLFSLLSFILFCAMSKAQYVNIPDSNFRNYLIGLYPSCFDTLGRMDTTCSRIINATSLSCGNKKISNLSGINYFKKLVRLICLNNKLKDLPNLPDNLRILHCQENELTSLPNLPNSLFDLECYSNSLTKLPNLPNNLIYLLCSYNQLTSLPNLPISLQHLSCNSNQLALLPILPKGLENLSCTDNINLFCLPFLPNSLSVLVIDTNVIKCIPNKPILCSFYFSNTLISDPKICNPTNNPNNCNSFPTIRSFAHINNQPKRNIKLLLSNNNYSYTNNQGTAFLNADSLGTYTVTAQAPPLFSVVPPSYTHTFNKYDTIVYDTFRLIPSVNKDSLSIKITAINWASRPGFNFAYAVNCENVGTTLLNPTNISVLLDTSKYIFDTCSNSSFSFNGNTLQGSIANFYPLQNINFIIYGKLKTTAALGSTLLATATATSSTVVVNDTAFTIIRGSYDPNDKQATPNLSVQQVQDNTHFIDYTIRFQNTGTDTAFTVVIADTLNGNKLQLNTLQLTGLSHNCKVTQNDHIVYFEFRDILLPDSNTNKIGSNGFVSFRVKPKNNLTNGDFVPNKAAIYFDYNSPIITNTAQTNIGVLPLTLLSFSAVSKDDKVLLYWNTANEINTSHFVVEISEDARLFAAATEVVAKGSGANSYYTSIAQKKIGFVRLKMMDKNGTFTYSNIIKLSNPKNKSFEILQNVVKNNLQISISNNNQFAKATLVNNQGKMVKSFITKNNIETIDIADLANGIYFLQINNDIEKFVVAK